MKREVRVEDAVGMVLAHDLTRIVPGEFKGVAFHKGHIIQPGDIPLMLDIGKQHIYVLELEAGELHENEAAVRMARAAAGPHLSLTDVHEGKVMLKSTIPGMVQVHEPSVLAMNLLDGISITTRRPYIHVDAGTSVAGVRPIPLVIAEDTVAAVERIAEEAALEPGWRQPVIDVRPYGPHRVAVVTTGSEIASGRIVDKFGPVLRAKFEKFGIPVVSQAFPGDDRSSIVMAIEAAVAEGASIVCVTGGMSVDPDDHSPAAIQAVAEAVVTYGTPMLPGSMLMLAYRGRAAIFGLPGAVIYDPVTSFDILLPRVLAGVAVTKEDIARLGVGGWLNA